MKISLKMVKDKPDKQLENKAAQETTRNATNDQQSGIWQDARFQHLVTDPRFKGLSKTQRKVKIDKRFQSMFTDDKFKVKYTVDKYGRKVNKSNAEDLRKYYEIDSSSESENEVDEEHQRRKEEKAISRDADESAEESAKSDAEPGENDDLISDGEEVPKTLKERLVDPNIDYARGEGRLISDSSFDDESTEDDGEEPDMLVDHVWGELDAEAETTEESTRRLAVCNMDWDRIRATDLLVLFSSFLQPGGSILSVKIYPSEFGKARMAEEELHGPQELVGLGEEVKPLKSSKNQSKDSDSEEDLVQEQDSDAEEGDDYHMEKLRQYQLKRLKYYYAVVECDSVQTADKIYKECDGIEYESSATRVDLRFVPDDTSFDEDVPADVCTELPDTNSYKPRQFTTTALQQAKVDLTWDETALERRELSEKLVGGKLDEVSDRDLRKIVAYSSEEEEVENEAEENKPQVDADALKNHTSATKTNKKHQKKNNVIDKYKALLVEINEKEQKQKNKKYEMEFSWNVNEAPTDKDEKDEEPNETTNHLLTPIEKVLQKRSEKNKKRKEERRKKKLQAKGIDPEQHNADSDLDSVPDGIDMSDPYFAEEFANGDFEQPKAQSKNKIKKQRKVLNEQEQEEEERQAGELQLLLDDEDLEDQGKQHFSLTKIQKDEEETKSKRKRRKQLKKSKSAIAEVRKQVEDNFQLNVDDDRFKAIYSSHLFNIDPTDSHFKKTKGMEQIIQQKLRRRHGSESENERREREEVEAKRPKKQLENALLVKSLKRKLQMKQKN